MTDGAFGWTFAGVWHAFTETGSHYEINFDDMTVRRDAGSGELRRDGEVLSLWAVDELKVGLPAELWVEVRTDGLLTFRRTSIVTALVPADENARLGFLDSDIGTAAAHDPAKLIRLPELDLPKATGCYAEGCTEGNALMLHLSVEPDGYADLCLGHAEVSARLNEVSLTCGCPVCRRARRHFDIPEPNEELHL